MSTHLTIWLVETENASTNLFIGKSFPYISCLSLQGLHEESTGKTTTPQVMCGGHSELQC